MSDTYIDFLSLIELAPGSLRQEYMLRNDIHTLRKIFSSPSGLGAQSCETDRANRLERANLIEAVWKDSHKFWIITKKGMETLRYNASFRGSSYVDESIKSK